MIPSHYNIEVTQSLSQPSLTYAIDPTTKRIVGRVDGLDAMFQSVTKLLNTERFAYIIYNDQYGVELESLIGDSPDYVKSVLEHRITDALITDDRFIELTNFNIGDITAENITFSVTVISNHGSITVDQGVNP